MEGGREVFRRMTGRKIICGKLIKVTTAAPAESYIRVIGHREKDNREQWLPFLKC